jgi:hypothetical protein
MLKSILVLIAFFTVFCRCDLFASTEELKELAEEHGNLVDEIKNLANSLDAFVGYLKWWVIDSEVVCKSS